MEFVIRKNSVYLDVTVRHGSAVIELGLLDNSERLALVRTLEEVIDELSEGLVLIAEDEDDGNPND